MGSPGDRQGQLKPPRGFGVLPPLRVLDDPLEGRLLVFGGTAPGLMRVVAAMGMSRYRLTPVLGEVEYLEPRSVLWPDWLPQDLLGYQTVGVLPTKHLLAVDLLRIISGATSRGDRRDGYYLWQTAGGTLASLTEVQLRQALASPWRLSLVARPTTDERAIALREE